MTNGEKQFVTLLGTFLRGEQAKIKDPDWPSVLKLGLSHNVAGIVAAQILLLPPQLRPQGSTMSKFTQLLGKTLQKHEMMRITAQRAEEALCAAGIRHAYVKGEQIGRFYPQPELRTSADTDIAIEPAQFSAAVAALEQAGFRRASLNADVAAFFDGAQEVELHKGLGEDFEHVHRFEEVCTSENGITFFPKPVFHLVYVVKHLIRHFENGGAGKIYLKNSIGDDGRISPATRLKALLTLLFPSAVYLRKQYPYAKCALLLPLAWLHRLLSAVFKRRAHSTQTIHEIMQEDETPKLYAKVSNELKKINKKK